MFSKLMSFTGLLSLLGLVYLIMNDRPVGDQRDLLARTDKVQQAPSVASITPTEEDNTSFILRTASRSSAADTRTGTGFTLPMGPVDEVSSADDRTADLVDPTLSAAQDLVFPDLLEQEFSELPMVLAQQETTDATSAGNGVAQETGVVDAGRAHQVTMDAKAEVQQRLTNNLQSGSISALERPVVDFARMSEDRSLLLIGRGPLESIITLWHEGQRLVEVSTDLEGQWSAFPDHLFRNSSTTLSISSRRTVSPDETYSEFDIMINQEARDGEPLIVLMARADERFGRVLQGGAIEEPASGLRFDHINYDRKGYLQLRGRSAAPGLLSISDDEGLIETLLLQSDSRWSVVLRDRPRPGIGLLRLVHKQEDGRVLAEIQMPIERMPKEALILGSPDDYLVIQPGSALWNVGRKLHDDGNRYLYMPTADDGVQRDGMLFPGHVLFAAGALAQ